MISESGALQAKRELIEGIHASMLQEADDLAALSSRMDEVMQTLAGDSQESLRRLARQLAEIIAQRGRLAKEAQTWLGPASQIRLQVEPFSFFAIQRLDDSRSSKTYLYFLLPIAEFPLPPPTEFTESDGHWSFVRDESGAQLSPFERIQKSGDRVIRLITDGAFIGELAAFKGARAGSRLRVTASDQLAETSTRKIINLGHSEGSLWTLEWIR